MTYVGFSLKFFLSCLVKRPPGRCVHSQKKTRICSASETTTYGHNFSWGGGVQYQNWSAYICYIRYTPPLHMHASYNRKAESLAIRGLLVYNIILLNMLRSLLLKFSYLIIFLFSDFSDLWFNFCIFVARISPDIRC